MSGPNTYQVSRITAKAPAFTTATAWRRAVTGVGATDAVGSQYVSGKTAAFVPKPKNPNRNAACQMMRPVSFDTERPAGRAVPPARDPP